MRWTRWDDIVEVVVEADGGFREWWPRLVEELADVEALRLHVMTDVEDFRHGDLEQALAFISALGSRLDAVGVSTRSLRVRLLTASLAMVMHRERPALEVAVFGAPEEALGWLVDGLGAPVALPG